MRLWRRRNGVECRVCSGGAASTPPMRRGRKMNRLVEICRRAPIFENSFSRAEFFCCAMDTPRVRDVRCRPPRPACSDERTCLVCVAAHMPDDAACVFAAATLFSTPIFRRPMLPADAISRLRCQRATPLLACPMPLLPCPPAAMRKHACSARLMPKWRSALSLFALPICRRQSCQESAAYVCAAVRQCGYCFA